LIIKEMMGEKGVKRGVRVLVGLRQEKPDLTPVNTKEPTIF
jgi:hypothetical protein